MILIGDDGSITLTANETFTDGCPSTVPVTSTVPPVEPTGVILYLLVAFDSL